MNAAEKKLDLFRKIDNLKDAEFDKLYSKFLALLNSSSPYKLDKAEKAAIEEAMEVKKLGNSFTHDQVMDEARTRYPNLKFK